MGTKTVGEAPTLFQFYAGAFKRARERGERFGQAAINHLFQVRPILAHCVEHSEMDPFEAATFDNPAWERFVRYIEENW